MVLGDPMVQIVTPLAQILDPQRQTSFSQTTPGQFGSFQAAGLQNQQREQQLVQGEQDIEQQKREQKLQSLAIGANEVLGFMESGNKTQVNKTLNIRRQKLIQDGLPTNDTDAFQKLFNENPKAALQEAKTAIDTANKVGVFGPKGIDALIGSRVQSSKKFTDGTVQLIMRDGNVRVINKNGEELTGTAAERAVEEANRAEVNQRSGIKGGEKRAGDDQARNTEFMNVGLEAADSIANLNRTLEILQSVETGGIDQAILAGKRFFGIESADEGQLSSGLGKSILAQLRPIFGAQFTEREGKRLERIEANLGKSPAANRRLIEEAKTIALRSARRAIRVAKSIGDDFTVSEIERAISFDVKEERQQRAAAEKPAPKPELQNLTPEQIGNLSDEELDRLIGEG